MMKTYDLYELRQKCENLDEVLKHYDVVRTWQHYSQDIPWGVECCVQLEDEALHCLTLDADGNLVRHEFIDGEEDFAAFLEKCHED